MHTRENEKALLTYSFWGRKICSFGDAGKGGDRATMVGDAAYIMSCLCSEPGGFLVMLLRRKKIATPAMRTKPAKPPTTPPAIAPACEGWEDCECDCEFGEALVLLGFEAEVLEGAEE